MTLSAPATPPEPLYVPVCPIDGSGLTPVALGPHTAPYLCANCRHGWWVEELRSVHLFRQGYRDFGYGAPMLALVAARDQEHAAAVERGTSVRSDTLALHPVATRQRLAKDKHISAAFVAEIKAGLK